MEPLTLGNTAKLYCLNWVQKLIIEKKQAIKILDLGCGEAVNFVNLLKMYPEISYMGIEPCRQYLAMAKKNLEGLNAKVMNAYAYNVYEQVKEKFDIVASFSVLEHVYRRMEYLRSAKECLKEDGYFVINYDAGHFRSNTMKSLFKNVLRSLFAHVGIERYYQSFVHEQKFVEMIEKVGFAIFDSKYLNSYSLKGFYQKIPHEERNFYMRHWLDFELSLNDSGIKYNDSFAQYFATRNFILIHK